MKKKTLTIELTTETAKLLSRAILFCLEHDDELASEEQEQDHKALDALLDELEDLFVD